MRIRDSQNAGKHHNADNVINHGCADDGGAQEAFQPVSYTPLEHAECDQTALLEVLPQEILARLILPLGEVDKESVQEIAQDIGCAE